MIALRAAMRTRMVYEICYAEKNPRPDRQRSIAEEAGAGRGGVAQQKGGARGSRMHDVAAKRDKRGGARPIAACE